MDELFPWTCPYCNGHAIIRKEDAAELCHEFDDVSRDEEHLKLTMLLVHCPNPECQQYVITATLEKFEWIEGYLSTYGDIVCSWNLKPQSKAKSFPSYIPKQLREDYEEACLIRDLSPKASATLSRRCLQGMIRNFHGIQEDTLRKEIGKLQGKIDPLVWKAIDAIRQLGNIGAHMEKDINLIIDVDPTEAAALIGLIEMLFEDWYIDRHERQQQVKNVIGIAQAKQQVKKQLR